MAAYPNELFCSKVLILNPAKRYCSKNLWSSGLSLLKNVSPKLPSILTSQLAQAIAAVCIGSPQEGHDVESSFLAISTNISLYGSEVKKNLDNMQEILIFCDLRFLGLCCGFSLGESQCSLTVGMAGGC